MRVAMVSTPFLAVPPRTYGGTELVVFTLTEGLRARGHDVTLFATGDSCTTGDLRALYRTAQWPPDILTDLDHVSWALRQVTDEPYDVVHVHSAVALAMQRLVLGAPFVYTLHHERDERLSRFYERFPRAVYVAISADQARREVRLPRLTVIHHGLDPAAYACARHPRDYVCFVGRFSEVKGPHVAIDVARLAGVPIRVAGEVHVPDQAFAERAVFPRLAQSHVTYLGPVDATVKRALLRDARALLAPIMWNEPFGLILIEAMLSGCPAIAFRRGSASELIEHGVTGFVVDTAPQMTALLRTPGPLCSFDRQRCRERAIERFGMTRMVEDYERCYARAIDEHGDGRPAGRRPTSVRIA